MAVTRRSYKKIGTNLWQLAAPVAVESRAEGGGGLTVDAFHALCLQLCTPQDDELTKLHNALASEHLYNFPSLGKNKTRKGVVRMRTVVEVERTLSYPNDLLEPSDNFLHTLRRLVKEVKESDPTLTDCDLYDIGFKRRGEKVYLRFYFKQS